MNKYLKTLELDKILQMLASHASNAETRRMALELRPDNDLERVRYECLKTSQALELSVQYGTPPFSDFKDHVLHFIASILQICFLLLITHSADIFLLLAQLLEQSFLCVTLWISRLC